MISFDVERSGTTNQAALWFRNEVDSEGSLSKRLELVGFHDKIGTEAGFDRWSFTVILLFVEDSDALIVMIGELDLILSEH